MKTNIIEEFLYKIKSLFRNSGNSYKYSTRSNNESTNIKKYLIIGIVLISGLLIFSNFQPTGLFASNQLQEELNDTKVNLELSQTILNTTEENLKTCQLELENCNSNNENFRNIILNEQLCEQENDKLDECKADLKKSDDLADDYRSILNSNGDIICCDGERFRTEKSWEINNGNFRCDNGSRYSNKVTC